MSYSAKYQMGLGALKQQQEEIVKTALEKAMAVVYDEAESMLNKAHDRNLRRKEELNDLYEKVDSHECTINYLKQRVAELEKDLADTLYCQEVTDKVLEAEMEKVAVLREKLQESGNEPEETYYQIGNSLSRCLKSILKGEMPLERVACIISGTRIMQNRQWEQWADSEIAHGSLRGFGKEEVMNLIEGIRERVIQPRGFEYCEFTPCTGNQPLWSNAPFKSTWGR